VHVACQEKEEEGPAQTVPVTGEEKEEADAVHEAGQEEEKGAGQEKGPRKEKGSGQEEGSRQEEAAVAR
jgi:hypothetical protein